MSKKNFINNKGSKRFGLFSVIALVAGIVIGSGIFQKNTSIIEGTGNQMDAIYAWIVGTILVLATVMAFIEIFSISNKSNKPGTLFYWSKSLIGPTTGKALAIIAVFVYVGMSLAAMPLWASNKVLEASGISISSIGQWQYFFSNWGIGLIFMIVIYGVAISSKSSQKVISNAGMGIKLVPLAFVIISAVVFMGMSSTHPITPTPIEGTEPTYGDNSFLNILSVLPAILFTYNGFITSASMSNEAKSTKTYKAGYIGGMSLVAVVYILYTISTFALGGTGLEDAVKSVVGADAGGWVFAIMQGAVIISMLSGLMGTSTAAPKHYANMSADNLFRDKEGKLLRRNREMMPQYAAWQLIGIAFVYQILFQGLDMIAIHTGVMPSNSYMMALNFATDFAAIFVFFAYGIILSAGIWNRKTGKVEVEKSKLFLPSATIAVLGIITVMGFQLYDTIQAVVKEANFVDITVLIILASTPFIVIKYNKIKTNLMDDKEIKIKEDRTKEYEDMIISKEFETGAKPFLYK